MKKHYISTSSDKIREDMLAMAGDDAHDLAAISELFEELNHYRWRKQAQEALREYREGEHSDRASQGFIEQTKLLLEKANFEEVGRKDIEFALEDKMLFELPIHIDWDAYAFPPMVYSRGTDDEVIESRFIFRKLSYYMLHGIFGVMLVSVVLLLLAYAAHQVSSWHEMRHAIVSTPRFEGANTLGPGDDQRFSLHFDDQRKPEQIEWSLFDGAGNALEGGISNGAIAELTPEQNGAHLQLADEIPESQRLLRIQAKVHGQEEILLSRELSITQQAEPPSHSKWALIGAWVLYGLGCAGLLVALWNASMLLFRDEHARLKRRAKGLSNVQARTRERMLKMRVDRFTHLFRMEKLKGQLLSRIVLIYQRKEDAKPSLKLFRDIPLADIELIFPATRLRMRLKDRVVLALSVVSALVVIVIKIVAILSAALFALWFLVLALVTAGGLATRTWQKFRNLVKNYHSTLTESLYYRNMDNDEGVLHYLFHHVEEQELTEILIGYEILRRHPDGLSLEDLRRKANSWLQTRFGEEGDFEAADAVKKLQAMNVVELRPSEGEFKQFGVRRTRETLEKAILAIFHPESIS